MGGWSVVVARVAGLTVPGRRVRAEVWVRAVSARDGVAAPGCGLFQLIPQSLPRRVRLALPCSPPRILVGTVYRKTLPGATDRTDGREGHKPRALTPRSSRPPSQHPWRRHRPGSFSISRGALGRVRNSDWRTLLGVSGIRLGILYLIGRPRGFFFRGMASSCVSLSLDLYNVPPFAGVGWFRVHLASRLQPPYHAPNSGPSFK